MPKKKDTSLNKNMNNNSYQPKKMNDTIDSFFDEPSTTLNITSKITDNSRRDSSPPNKMDFARTSINFNNNKNELKIDNEIIDEDNSFRPSFSKVTTRDRSKSPTSNQIKLPEENTLGIEINTASMRNMRPPLKRKQSQTGFGQKNASNNLSLGLNLSEEKKQTKPSQNLMLSLNEDFDSKPTKSMNLGRRGSMDNKGEKKFEGGLSLYGNETNQFKNTN